MALTTGLVQRVNVSAPFTCVWVGPTPANSELLTVTHDGTPSDIALAATFSQALTAAATNYRRVTAEHGDSDSKILSIEFDPV